MEFLHWKCRSGEPRCGPASLPEKTWPILLSSSRGSHSLTLSPPLTQRLDSQGQHGPGSRVCRLAWLGYPDRIAKEYARERPKWRGNLQSTRHCRQKTYSAHTLGSQSCSGPFVSK